MMAFWRDQKGSVAVIVAVSTMILIMIVGAAIDLGTATHVRSSLQGAVDAASLAAGKADPVVDPQGMPKVAETQEALRVVAQNVFNANNAVSRLATVDPVKITYTAPVGITPDTVLISISARMPTTFLSIFGIGSLDIAVESKSQRPQPGPVDLVLVLDTTASMAASPASGGQRKIDTLKVAATQLVNQVMASGSANIQVGVVPYTSYVNVGLRNPVPDWVIPIERDYCSSYTWQFPGNKCTTWKYDCLIDGVMKQNACTGQDCTPLGKQICTGMSRSPWGGCIGARTVLNNVPTNIAANTSTDAFLDKISSPTDPKYSGQSLLSTGNNALCPKPIVGLTTNRAGVLASIAGLVAAGDTHIPNGLIWGWNVLSPGEPYAARTKEQLEAIGGRKVLLLMTDGINANSPRMIDGAYLANGSTSLTLPWRDGSKSNTLTADVCNNIKADGIQIFTVLFDVPAGSGIESILKNCASDPDTMSFNARNTDDLLRAFRNITDQLMALKIVQ